MIDQTLAIGVLFVKVADRLKAIIFLELCKTTEVLNLLLQFAIVVLLLLCVSFLDVCGEIRATRC